ncbi:unnamed protein product, partial [Gulo gulo]
PSPRNRSRCADFRWEAPAYPHLTTLLHSGSTRPEVWKSASESVMQLVPGHQRSEKTADPGCTSMPGWEVKLLFHSKPVGFSLVSSEAPVSHCSS